MALLDRNALLAKQQLKIEKITLDKDNYVFIKEMTAHEKELYEDSLRKKVVDKNGNITFEQDSIDFRAKLAVCLICDEKGNLILTPNDYKQLSNNISHKRLQAIVEKGIELNKLDIASQEEAEKNSEAVKDGDSTSGSA